MPKLCALEGCNKPARRRFCCNAHKDRYHNLHNPRGKYAHLKDKAEREHLKRLVESKIHISENMTQFEDVEDDIHPYSGDNFDW